MQQMYTSGASSLAHLLGDDDEALPSVFKSNFATFPQSNFIYYPWIGNACISTIVYSIDIK